VKIFLSFVPSFCSVKKQKQREHKMAKVFIADFKSKKVEMVLDGEELQLPAHAIAEVDYSAGLRLVTDEPSEPTPPARDYLSPLFEAISNSDQVMNSRGYFNIYNYDLGDKLFESSVESTLEKLRRAQNLINEQVYLMENLLADSQEFRDAANSDTKPVR